MWVEALESLQKYDPLPGLLKYPSVFWFGIGKKMGDTCFNGRGPLKPGPEQIIPINKSSKHGDKKTHKKCWGNGEL